MFKSLQTQLKRAGRWLPVALLPFAAHAQLAYTVSNTSNVSTTYTDLGTTGSVIATANTDDANSAATPLGFTFTYNGTAFTDFILNTNGFIKLGTTAPSSAALYFTGPQDASVGGPTNSTSPADANILMPFNVDLESATATAAEYRVATTGTAGSRVATIQWKNVSDKLMTAPSGKQYASMQFQARLFEGSNRIEFVYGPAVAGPGPDAFKFVAVGIKGSSNSTTNLITLTKPSSALWSMALPMGGSYTANAHNVRSTVLPDAGRTYRFTPPVANDAAVSTVYTLTKLPIPQGVPHAVQAVITNNGTAAQSATVVTLNVTGSYTFTNTQTVASLAPGASTTVTFAPYMTTVVGTNTVTVTVPADGNNSNNSSAVTQAVNTSTYSYADASAPTSARGFGPSATAVNSFDVKYTANTSVNVTQVRALLVDFVGAGTPGSTIGKTVYAVVVNPTTGALLGRSADFVIAAADVTGTAYTTFTLTTPVAVPVNTDFLVGIAQTYQAGQTTQYFPIGTQPELPAARVGAYYIAGISTPAAPTDVTVGATAANPANYRFMLEAVTTSTSAAACTPVGNLTAGSITQTGATITFVAPAGTGGYIVTYTPAGGTATTITPAPTGSPIVLTGLASGTTYTVSVVTSCSTGANSISTTTTFSTLAPAPTYATLPYAQDFETWINVAGNQDVPSNSWRNTPPTGDNSWRREDQGATANWQFLSYETPTMANPIPPYVIRFSTGAHSARFHSFGAAAGQQGTLDLYVNLNVPTGSRVLTFDYINPSGTDNLVVLLSTDGGATFGATPLLTATTNTAFTTKTVVIPSSSATAVIRFQATSDFGNDDLGIDNLQVRVTTATRDQALAAAVGLFPNPTHQRFTLSVPAGSLHAATATLLNTLGQVVQVRQLNLPATGGMADFDVSTLAAGVYSLRLQTGDALVVKQVVVE